MSWQQAHRAAPLGRQQKATGGARRANLWGIRALPVRWVRGPSLGTAQHNRQAGGGRPRGTGLCGGATARGTGRTGAPPSAAARSHWWCCNSNSPPPTDTRWASTLALTRRLTAAHGPETRRNIKTMSPGIRIPNIKRRQSNDCLIFIMGISILTTWQLYTLGWPAECHHHQPFKQLIFYGHAHTVVHIFQLLSNKWKSYYIL